MSAAAWRVYRSALSCSWSKPWSMPAEKPAACCPAERGCCTLSTRSRAKPCSSAEPSPASACGAKPPAASPTRSELDRCETCAAVRLRFDRLLIARLSSADQKATCPASRCRFYRATISALLSPSTCACSRRQCASEYVLAEPVHAPATCQEA